MQYYPFDSRNPIYRDKIGALAEGETLRLRLLLHNDAKVHSAYLRIRNDAHENTVEVLMKPSDWLEDYRYYECEINLTEGLYWYSFRIRVRPFWQPWLLPGVPLRFYLEAIMPIVRL